MKRSMSSLNPGHRVSSGHRFGPTRRACGGSLRRSSTLGAAASTPNSTCSRQSGAPAVFSAPRRTYPRNAGEPRLSMASFAESGRAKKRREAESAPDMVSVLTPWSAT